MFFARAGKRVVVFIVDWACIELFRYAYLCIQLLLRVHLPVLNKYLITMCCFHLYLLSVCLSICPPACLSVSLSLFLSLPSSLSCLFYFGLGSSVYAPCMEHWFVRRSHFCLFLLLCLRYRWLMEENLTTEAAESLLRACGSDGSFIISNTSFPNIYRLYCRWVQWALV